jgi:peptide/nickel transport system permease protein
MGRYLVRRALFGILVLLIISFVTFLIFMKLPPGDPARRLAGKGATPEILEQVRINFGLDQPFFTQYGRFVKGLLPWPGEDASFLDPDIYYSWSNRVEVRDEIARAFPVTLVLTAGAMILWLIIGIPIGIVSALKRRSVADRSAMTFALLGVSFPTFLLGLLLLYVFYYKLRWAPPSGFEINDNAFTAMADGKFILAWITLAVTSAAYYTRVVRGNMLETMSEDYIRTARAKGLSENRVIYKHAMRSTLTPVVTMLGLDVAVLLGGAVITESVFNLHGLGLYALRSLELTDFPAVMAVTILAAVFIIVANLVVDIVYAFLDPRVRFT